MSTRLMLLPYLQAWDGDQLSLRLLAAPQGSPLDPLAPGEPSFTDAAFQLELRLVAGLGAIPTTTTTFTSIVVANPAPPQATAICQALAATLPIDPTVPLVDGRKAGTRMLKYAPPGYRNATGYGGSSNPFVVTDDRYRCAVSAPVPSGTVLKSDVPNLSWGKVLANVLRQPALAEAVGLVREATIRPPADFFTDGGFLYVTLAAGSPGASLTGIPDALKSYAARVPPLRAPRTLFTSVLFPVAALPPAASYDTIFQEAVDYDDGFAKAVYAAQPERLDPLQEEDDGTRPANDLGVRLGWDDEQIATWLNRQIDPAAAMQDAPMGVMGYRIDAREQGTADWQSLVVGRSSITVGGVDVGDYRGEYRVEIAPNRHMGDTSGTYWLPSYYTNWTGPSLAGPDPIARQIQGLDPRAIVTGVPPELALRYGKKYEFRVRLVDHTGGGPDVDTEPRNPSPRPIGALAFKRWVRPQAVRLDDAPPAIPDPAIAPSTLTVERPRLGYPAYVFAGGSAADILADLPRATAERRGIGLPDLDVLAVEIEVQVAQAGQASGYLTLYTTTRSFPSDPSAALDLALSWRDVADATTLTAPSSGPLPLPTSRNVRVLLTAVGRDDAGYFGAEDARRGPAVTVALRKDASDERGLFEAFTPGDAIHGLFLQPDQTADLAVLAAQKLAGKGQEAPDNALGRLAVALDVEVRGMALRARRGERVLFGCSPLMRHVIGPDGGSLTFAAVSDLTLRWIVALRLELGRDWSWDGLRALDVERDGVVVGRLDATLAIAAEALDAPTSNSSTVLFLDAIDPRPPAGQFPLELTPRYRITPRFSTAPATVDPPVELSVHLPITTPPSQVPRLASAGIALSPYKRSDDYSSTEPRRRALWLEFQSAPENPADAYFARVLANAPDPVLLPPDVELPETAEPPLPIDPEPIRRIVPGQSDDKAGLGAMQLLVPTDSPRHFLLPLPPGLTEDSPALFGFFTYELRVGHHDGWSIAQGRFGRPLRVTGVQHPAPTLTCAVTRTRQGLVVSAPFANPVLGAESLRPRVPHTQLWVLLYAQYVQADGGGRRNVLLDRRQATFRRERWSEYERQVILAADNGAATWSNAEIKEMLSLLALSGDTPLSCLAVETLPADEPVPDPVGAGLGYERFLRTSPLTPIPDMCL